MKYKNRPKYVTEMLDECNRYLRNNKVKDVTYSKRQHRDNLFLFMCDYLLSRNLYRGYNFYKEVYTYKNSEGQEVYLDEPRLALAGSTDPSKYDCVQIW